MRFDLRIIASWITPGARVLDLGCGDGALLCALKQRQQVVGTGIERNEDKVARCIEKGLSVIQGDINEEILDYPDKAFDYVILSQTLQQGYEPAALIASVLRVSRKGIVSFPNFSYWGVRLQLLLTGYAPVTKELPYQWHDTPNIRIITLKDFRKFAKEVDFEILKEAAIQGNADHTRGHIVRVLASLRATYGIFLIADRKE